jgi:hypothetical protein
MAMRNLDELDKYRERTPEVLASYGSYGDGTAGVFRIPYPLGGMKFLVIASAGDGWDHVSASLPDRCPTWPEMDFLKRAFFLPDEVAMQLHVAEKDHINFNPRTLHIWRPHAVPIPLPPKVFV